MDQARAVAKGRPVDGDVLPEVTAFLDQRHFGALPHAGGTLDQPAWLMDGMRLIASVVSEEEAREAKREQANRKR